MPASRALFVEGRVLQRLSPLLGVLQHDADLMLNVLRIFRSECPVLVSFPPFLTNHVCLVFSVHINLSLSPLSLSLSLSLFSLSLFFSLSFSFSLFLFVSLSLSIYLSLSLSLSSSSSSSSFTVTADACMVLLLLPWLLLSLTASFNLDLWDASSKESRSQRNVLLLSLTDTQ